MLLEAHTRLTRLASTMDVNDFIHVNCTYFPRSSRSKSQFEIVPVDIPLPSTRADFDVSYYLNERSPIIGSGFKEPFDQYGSQLGREEEDSPVLEEHVVSPSRQWSSLLQPSPRVSPSHPSSTGGGVPPHYEDVDLFSQPEVASSTTQVIDIEPLASPTRPASDVFGQIQDAPIVEEIAVVVPSAREVEVINCSDIDSCDSKRRLLGDSTDEDSDDDNDDVNEGIPLPTAPALELDIVDPALAPRFALVVDSLPPASTIAASSSIPTIDKFYNAAGKVPHPESIILKQESGWWANREMQKRRKAEERANSARELQRIQEEATRLLEQNATLQQELNLAR